MLRVDFLFGTVFAGSGLRAGLFGVIPVTFSGRGDVYSGYPSSCPIWGTFFSWFIGIIIWTLSNFGTW